MTARKKLLLGAAVVLSLLVAGGRRVRRSRARPEDVSNPNVEFDAEPTATAVPDAIPEEPTPGSKKVDPLRNFVWADYGYSKDRRKLPARLQAAAAAVLARLDATPGRSCSSSRR